MGEKQRKRRRRLERMAADGGMDIIAEVYRRLGGDEKATALWLAKAAKQAAINPTVTMRDLMPPLQGESPEEPNEGATPNA